MGKATAGDPFKKFCEKLLKLAEALPRNAKCVRMKHIAPQYLGAFFKKIILMLVCTFLISAIMKLIHLNDYFITNSTITNFSNQNK